VNKWSSLTAD